MKFDKAEKARRLAEDVEDMPEKRVSEEETDRRREVIERTSWEVKLHPVELEWEEFKKERMERQKKLRAAEARTALEEYVKVREVHRGRFRSETTCSLRHRAINCSPTRPGVPRNRGFEH